jgi:transglutaminase-like putative cysteine protease
MTGPRPFSMRSGLTLALWLVAMRTLAAGLANTVKETSVNGFFPVAVLGFLLGWAGELLNANITNVRMARMSKEKFATFANSRHSRSELSGWSTYIQKFAIWIFILLLGTTFAFIHNGHLAQPLANFMREGLRYQWQKIESISDPGTPDPSEFQNAQAQLTRSSNEVWSRVTTWIKNVRAGEKEEDPFARQIVWSLLALALAAWAGWILQKRGSALAAMLPSTSLLAYLQYYSAPDPLTFLLHLLTLLLLVAVTEGSAPLRASNQTRSISGDALIATFLVSCALIIIAALTPSVSAKAIAKAVEAGSRTAQNDSTAKALGLDAAQNGGAPSNYIQPGLPREHLLQGSPKLSQTVVFTVRTGDLPPMQRLNRDEQPPRYYWRTITYDIYTGRGWAITLNDSRDEKASALLLDSIPTGYRLIHLDVNMLVPSSRLAWTGELVRADQPLRTAWRTLPNSRAASLDPLYGADLIAAVTDAQTFHVESILPAFTAGQLRASPADYPAWVRGEYLNLPADLPSRVRDLAMKLTADQPTSYDRALAIESYLRKFPYTLDVPTPPADRDVADYFLFDLQTGYCDYYATAMVVLARAAGLPARLVSGYASGTYIPAEAYYQVKEADAHSWVEIYFTGLGWVEFEPTANRPLIERAQASYTEITVIDVPQESSVTPAKRMLMILQKVAALPALSLLAGLLVVSAIFVSVGLVRDRRRQNAPVKTITEIYKQVYRMGKNLTGELQSSHTPFTFAKLLEKHLDILPRSKFILPLIAPAKEELSTLTDMYVRAIYSPVLPTREETIRAIKIWRKLFWRLWLVRFSEIR